MRGYGREFRVLISVGYCLATGAGVGSAVEVGRLGPVPQRMVLRIARSQDGARFLDTGEVFLRGASAPDIIRLPNDHLLAIFDNHNASNQSQSPVLAVSRSTNEGRTWSTPRPIRLQGSRDTNAVPVHADLLITPKGLLRMYFAMSSKGGDDRPEGRQGRPASVVSAVTRDGMVYHVDPDVTLPCPGCDDPHPSSAVIGKDIVLLIADPPNATRKPADNRRETRSMRCISSDGRRFRSMRADRESLPVGDILSVRGDTIRMFYAYEGDLLSLLSADGRRWRRDPTTCLKNATDGAAVSLKDGTYFMLYNRADERDSTGQTQLVPTSDQNGDTPGEDHSSDTDSDTAESTVSSWAPFTETPVEEEIGGESADVDGWGDELADGFAPKADLRHPVDYSEWLRQNMLYPEEGNAWEAYGPLIDQAFKRPDWEGLTTNMLGSEYAGPVVPWDPKEFPVWEEAYQTTKGLLDEYSQVTMHPGPFSIPFVQMIPEEPMHLGTDGRSLLFYQTLPGLSHIRGLTKGILSNAWRAEGGTVDPEAMREAFDTVLRNSNHTAQGTTLIEGLVSMALQGIVQDHAMLALEYNVFQTPEEMSATLERLRANNTGGYRLAAKLPTDHACMMDMLQYLCEPDQPDGEPYVHLDRAETLYNDFSGGGDYEAWASTLTVPSVEAAIDAGQEYYEGLSDLWRQGYPSVRKSDLERRGEERCQESPVLRPFVPALGRAYELEHRIEAGRRATELTYEIHLFKAQQGRWPASLDELPIDGGSECRVDPFSGTDFRYRLTEDGFKVYSVNANGVDDGGAHDPDDDRDGAIGADDFVFWPPQ